MAASENSSRWLGDDAAPSTDVQNLIARYEGATVNVSERYLGLITESVQGGAFIAAHQDTGTCEIGTDLHGVDDWLMMRRVSTADGSSYRAQVALRDEAHDLAILRISGVENPTRKCKVIPLSDEQFPAQPGDPVLLLNAPKIDIDPGADIDQIRRLNRKPQDGLGELVRYNLLGAVAPPEVIEGEDPNTQIVVAYPGTYLGDSGLPFVSVKTGATIGLADIGGNPNMPSYLTHARYLKNDLDALYRQDEEAQRAEKELSGFWITGL